MQLVHPILKRMTEQDIVAIFGGCESIGAFMHRINQFAASKAMQAVENERSNVENKWKGDLFELFGEFYIKEFSSSRHLNLKDYSPNLEEDYGVDGHAICCRTNSPLVVQFKYKGNRDAPLNINESKLANMYTQAGPLTENPRFKVQHLECYWFVSTARETGSEVGNNPSLAKARFILFDELDKMTRNVNHFWERLVEDCLIAIRSFESIKLEQVQLRQHQQEYVESEGNELRKKGQIWCPTGSGKSIMEMELMRRLIDGKISCEKGE